MLEQPSGIVRFQLFKKSETSMVKHDEATHRQSTVRWLVLELETLNEALSTLAIATTVCPVEKSSALKIVIRCESADGTMLTYVIDRLTGEIVAQSHAEQVTLTGKCKRTEKAL